MEDGQIRSRAKKKLIRVTFPDGEVICYNNATSTMIAALNKIGSDKFPSIIWSCVICRYCQRKYIPSTKSG